MAYFETINKSKRPLGISSFCLAAQFSRFVRWQSRDKKVAVFTHILFLTFLKHMSEKNNFLKPFGSDSPIPQLILQRKTH